jgi:hypothetical protein
MKKVYEVLMQHPETKKLWRVDVLANDEAMAAIRASSRMRREHGITDCTWDVQGICCIADTPAKLRPSKSYTEQELAK